MTGQACITVVLIPADLIMIFIGFILLMTAEATKNGVIIRVGVTVGTLIPFIFVFATVDGEVEIIVIPG